MSRHAARRHVSDDLEGLRAGDDHAEVALGVGRDPAAVGER
jgi:hypothetical protein